MNLNSKPESIVKKNHSQLTLIYSYSSYCDVLNIYFKFFFLSTFPFAQLLTMSSTGTTSLFQTLTPQNGFNLNTQSPPQQQTQQQQQPPSLLNNTATTTNPQNLTGDQNQKSIPQVNVLHTVPVFFVNSQKEEKNKRPFEPEELQRSGSISLNYGDRRLSNILSDVSRRIDSLFLLLQHYLYLFYLLAKS